MTVFSKIFCFFACLALCCTTIVMADDIQAPKGEAAYDFASLSRESIREENAKAANDLNNLHERIREKLKSLEDNPNKTVVRNEVFEFVKKQPEVEQAAIEGSYIAITDKTGFVSYVFIPAGSDMK